jgi:ABC-type multidrug transport system fused ATPase/permease subunit
LLDYLIVVLLVLIFIGVLFLIRNSSFRNAFDDQQVFYQKMSENNRKLILEITELKKNLEHSHTLLQHAFEQWRTERQEFETAKQSAVKSSKRQNLFLNDRYSEIFELQEQGLSVEQIAKELGKGCGEVSFILQLAVKERT